MTDAEFFAELMKRIGDRDFAALGLVEAGKVRVKVGSLEVISETGIGWNAVITMDGRTIYNCSKIAIILDGSSPGIFVAMEIDPSAHTWNDVQYCLACQKAGKDGMPCELFTKTKEV